MLRKTSPLIAFLLVAAASGVSFGADLKQLAVDAVGADAEKSQSAIAELRKAGPAGLDAVITAHADIIEDSTRGGAYNIFSRAVADKSAAANWTRIKTAIDKVAGQKDAYASKLYWYTDHQEALKAAAEAHKPILSLRMLGKLTDDLSCANSRFFRTTLYPNAEVSKFLREHFILEWESVRPVPKITIDMGDGRKIERTITGNSIHYILDEKGRVIDGVPGLYGAKAFLTQLAVAETQAKAAAKLDDAAFVKSNATYHIAANTLINEAWQQEFINDAPQGALSLEVADRGALLFAGEKKSRRVAASIDVQDQAQAPRNARPAAAGFPDAERAARITASKVSVERPMILAVAPQPEAPKVDKASDEVWQKIATRHAAAATIDGKAQALMAEKNPAMAANILSVGKGKVETPMLRMVRTLQNNIAIDTVRNEYSFHASIHQWLGAANKPVVLKDFNDRVYADLFLTPRSDPWLGLVPSDAYSALDNEGLCTDVAAK